jgi:hypothetical protein
MSAQQPYADNDNTDIHEQALHNPAGSPARVMPAPRTKRRYFEDQPSASILVPQYDDATKFDLWETDDQGDATQKQTIDLTVIEESGATNDQLAFVTYLMNQLREMWTDLAFERDRYDKLCGKILEHSTVINQLRDEAQDHEDAVAGYQGDIRQL